MKLLISLTAIFHFLFPLGASAKEFNPTSYEKRVLITQWYVKQINELPKSKNELMTRVGRHLSDHDRFKFEAYLDQRSQSPKAPKLSAVLDSLVVTQDGRRHSLHLHPTNDHTLIVDGYEYSYKPRSIWRSLRQAMAPKTKSPKNSVWHWLSEKTFPQAYADPNPIPNPKELALNRLTDQLLEVSAGFTQAQEAVPIDTKQSFYDLMEKAGLRTYGFNRLINIVKDWGMYSITCPARNSMDEKLIGTMLLKPDIHPRKFVYKGGVLQIDDKASHSTKTLRFRMVKREVNEVELKKSTGECLQEGLEKLYGSLSWSPCMDFIRAGEASKEALTTCIKGEIGTLPFGEKLLKDSPQLPKNMAGDALAAKSRCDLAASLGVQQICPKCGEDSPIDWEEGIYKSIVPDRILVAESLLACCKEEGCAEKFNSEGHGAELTFPGETVN